MARAATVGWMRAFATAAVSIALLGCGSARSTSTGSTWAPMPETESNAIIASRSPAPSRPPGPLTRAEAQALVARGLGPFLARVEVLPVFASGHFVGFRLESAQDLANWRSAGADIRVGDVILRVNGIRIERPEQALWAFERLRIADAVEVELLRDGSTVTVRSPIVDDVHARAQE